MIFPKMYVLNGKHGKEESRKEAILVSLVRHFEIASCHYYFNGFDKTHA